MAAAAAFANPASVTATAVAAPIPTEAPSVAAEATTRIGTSRARAIASTFARCPAAPSPAKTTKRARPSRTASLAAPTPIASAPARRANPRWDSVGVPVGRLSTLPP